MATFTLAVDCMGGDHGPDVTLAACAAFLNAHPSARVIGVGLPEVAARAAALELGAPRFEFKAASEVVAMDDGIEVALRRKKDSSMRVALELVKQAQAHACVSAGNTGALMAVARYVLKTLQGIDRPAIATWLPNKSGSGTLMLDLGANVDCSAEHLLQFAVMGSALEQATAGVERPSIGLLNIGEEVIKGNDVIKQAGELLRAAGAHGALNFKGNIEGDDIFKGTVDIVVCDGFVGNVALKTSEGLAQMIGALLREAFMQNAFTKALGLLASPALKAFKHRVDHRRYNGAALVGLRGLVIKSHGGADAFAFEQALNRAYEGASHGVIERIEQTLAQVQAELAPKRSAAAEAA